MMNSRKSDIENERLPPKPIDVDPEEGMTFVSSLPPEHPQSPYQPITPNGFKDHFGKTISPGKILPTLSKIDTSSPPSPASRTSPVRPSSAGRIKRRHSTTVMSPTRRRRSLESTMSLIQGVLDGREGGIAEEDEPPPRWYEEIISGGSKGSPF